MSSRWDNDWSRGIAAYSISGVLEYTQLMDCEWSLEQNMAAYSISGASEYTQPMEWMMISGQNDEQTFGSEFQEGQKDDRYQLRARNRMRTLVVKHWGNEEDIDKKGKMDATGIDDFPRLKKIFNQFKLNLVRVDGTYIWRTMREWSFCQ